MNWAKYIRFYKDPLHLKYFFYDAERKGKKKMDDWSGSSTSNILKTTECHDWQGK